ncbi:uncharacterized protein LOC129617520 [Condylostylus longicornis]|uniref:uncharacterized protein LOC129617520 n=1 Tax=Condylostylus longicornis TaxID=2530218 RepID=UPI00244DA70A|nr:uncharacterized protein LOC129617520 [Condylostylus longicornis]
MLATGFQQRGRATRSKRPELSAEQIEELREVFVLFDINKKNSIDAREFKAALRALGFDVKREHIISIMSEAGKEFNETITFEEFCQMMVGRMPDKTSKEEILKLFRLFDEDGNGKISFRNLKKISSEVGENLTDDELQEMIDEADRDGDGVVDFEEFFRIMRYRHDPLEDSEDDE